VHDHHPKIRINKPRREENNMRAHDGSEREREKERKGKDSRIAEMTKSEI
jgi:hypothetical protein